MSFSKMLTSTPTKRTKSSIPFKFDEEDASSIGNETFIGSPEDTESSNDYSEQGVSEYELFLQERKLPKIRVWMQKNFPPNRDDSIYGKFVQNLTNGTVLAKCVLNEYTNDRKNVFIEILQFCLDVSNVKSFPLKKYYNFEANNAEEIIKKIDANDQLISDHYVLERLVDQNLYVKMTIFHFLNKLIHSAHEKGILQDEFFFNRLFQFLRCMSLSEYLCLRHTGTAFSVVILTTIVEIVGKRPTESLNNTITLLFSIFTKNYFITDNKLTGLRYDCLNEMSKWMISWPRLFINQYDCCKYLNDYFIDENKIIRLLALNKCKKLFTHEPTKQYLNNRLDMLLTSITERFNDVEDDVVLRALNLFSLLTDIYPDKCIEKKQHFSNVLFYENNNVAHLAAECILKLYKMENNSDWCNLIGISLYFKNELKCGLLVNSFLTVYDAITNWKLFINIFLTCETVNVALENLSCIFFEAVHQVLLQKPSILLDINRIMQFPEPDEANNDRFAFEFIPNLSNLIEKFSKNNTIFKNLLKIFNLINHKDLTRNYQENYEEILTNLIEIYKTETVLEVLSTTFRTFNTNIFTIEDNINELVVYLCENNQISHITYLFRHFNLIDCPLNVQTDEENSLVCLEYRKWFIIWSIRTCIQQMQSNDTTSIDLYDILNKYKNLIAQLLVLLKNESDSSNAKTMFTLLCDLLTIFQNEIKENVTLDDQLNDFQFEIEANSENEDVLIKFYEKFVIPKTSNLQLYVRENLIFKTMVLFASKSIKHTVIVHVFRYYNSHFDIFGKVYEEMIRILKSAFSTYVFMTFQAIYLDIINKYQSFDNNLLETKQLNLLAAKFAQNAFFKTSSENSSTLISLILLYVFKDGADIDFLYLARYFIKHLSIDDNSKLKTYFNSEVDNVESGKTLQDLSKAFNERMNDKRGNR